MNEWDRRIWITTIIYLIVLMYAAWPPGTRLAAVPIVVAGGVISVVMQIRSKRQSPSPFNRCSVCRRPVAVEAKPIVGFGYCCGHAVCTDIMQSEVKNRG